MSNKAIEKLLGARVQELKDAGVFRHLPVLEGRNLAESMIDGKLLINLASNSYLGLTNHPRVIKAALDATEKYGVGPGAVRTINGNMTVHEELDTIIAKFKQEEAAHHFQSGFNCNSGAIQALMEKGDLIISDELNHASIIDGVRLSRADKAVYKHSDMNDLERVLKEKRANYNNVLIITDGVFSMDGDLAPLPDLVKLAKQYDALTYVDDAHGSGVIGKSGRGTVDHFHLHGEVDFIIGTLSKGIGVIGGYVASSRLAYDWLNHRSRTTLFSTTLSPASAAAAIEVYKILMETEEYTIALWDNARYFKEKLAALGFDTGHSETPITPVMIGEEAKSVQFAQKLKDKGVFVAPIIFPTVPKGTGRVRCMIRADHTKEQLDRAVQAFKEVKEEMNI